MSFDIFPKKSQTLLTFSSTNSNAVSNFLLEVRTWYHPRIVQRCICDLYKYTNCSRICWRKSPKIVPSGTRCWIWIQSEVQLGCFSIWILYLRKLFIMDTALLSKFSVFDFSRSMSCEIEARAFKRSKNAAQKTSLPLVFLCFPWHIRGRP